MACDITLGRLEPCKSVGGLKSMFIINFESIFYNDKVVDADDVISVLSTTTDGVIAYKYELRGTNNFDEANEVSKENGTSFWTSTGTVTLKNQDAVTRKQMKLLSLGRPIIITEGYDSSFKIYGLENGCDVAVNTVSGAGMGDLNGYNLTITAMESSPAYFMESDWQDDPSVLVVLGT